MKVKNLSEFKTIYEIIEENDNAIECLISDAIFSMVDKLEIYHDYGKYSIADKPTKVYARDEVRRLIPSVQHYGISIITQAVMIYANKEYPWIGKISCSGNKERALEIEPSQSLFHMDEDSIHQSKMDEVLVSELERVIQEQVYFGKGSLNLHGHPSALNRVRKLMEGAEGFSVELLRYADGFLHLYIKWGDNLSII